MAECDQSPAFRFGETSATAGVLLLIGFKLSPSIWAQFPPLLRKGLSRIELVLAGCPLRSGSGLC